MLRVPLLFGIITLTACSTWNACTDSVELSHMQSSSEGMTYVTSIVG